MAGVETIFMFVLDDDTRVRIEQKSRQTSCKLKKKLLIQATAEPFFSPAAAALLQVIARDELPGRTLT